MARLRRGKAKAQVRAAPRYEAIQDSPVLPSRSQSPVETSDPAISSRAGPAPDAISGSGPKVHPGGHKRPRAASQVGQNIPEDIRLRLGALADTTLSVEQRITFAQDDIPEDVVREAIKSLK